MGRGAARLAADDPDAHVRGMAAQTLGGVIGELAHQLRVCLTREEDPSLPM